jgi:adenosylmethionine-8-amino-7-oxononanoate aminotransferase
MKKKITNASKDSVTSLNNTFNNLWMPFTSYQDMLDYPPLTIERGSGIYLFDSNGRGYIDGIGSWWVSIFGHNNPEITNAIKEQLDKLEHVMMAGLISEPALRLSHLIKEILPDSLTRIFYSDNGSTSVEVALKIALQYHMLRGSNRSEFVSFEGGYHGDTLGAMSVGMIPKYHSCFHERFKKQHFASSPYCYRCPVGKDVTTCNAECMDSLRDILNERGEQIAACIFEPMVQGAVGMRVYPPKVLTRIFSLCKEFEILTIADEVAMGLGRTGTMFACDHAGAVPDIMCLAKGLTGGYLPLSATIVKEFIFDEFKGDYRSDRIFEHGHTFTGNALAASAACAAMGLFKKYDIPSSLKKVISKFQHDLEKFNIYDIVGDIRTIGLVGAIELVKNKDTRERLPDELRIPFKICQRALKYGLIIRPLGNVIYFMPSFIITEDQMDNMLFITHMVIKETIHEELSNIR